MLQAANIHKSYGHQTLFNGISFSMAPGERLGLIGRNGSGKSTIFRMITGEEMPDEGRIVLPRGYRAGHLEQHLKFTESTVLHEACLGLPPEERDQEYRGAIILSGLGFSDDDLYRSPLDFSGGFQIRINLAKVLLSEPNLLLLDEPTNYLDIVSARWLSRFLSSWPNEMILISHDRDFMDSVTTHTMLIHRQGVKKIQGGTEKLLMQVAQDEEIYEKTRINEDRKRREIETFINRFRAKASKATLVQSRVKALERMGSREELRDEKVLDFEFNQAPFQGKVLLEARNLSFSYSSDQPELVKDFSITIRPGDRIGVIGKNGKGKSTLLRLIAEELKPSAGYITRSSYTRQGYFGQTNVGRLNPKLTVEEEIFQANNALSRTAVRNICGVMMFDGDKALKKISVLSGGEKSRVLLGRILAEPSNLLLLDEPSNHLDMESIESLNDSLQDYQGAVVIVTHSELALRQLATRLVVFQEDGPEIFEGGYDYFLDKIGWVDEADLKPSKASKKKEADRDEKKNRPTSPSAVEKEVKSLDRKIDALEKQLEDLNRELMEASEEPDTVRIAEIGIKIKDVQSEVAAKYAAMEELMKEL